MTDPAVFVGTELPTLKTEPITRKTLALFAGASGDHQPTHIDIDAARAKGRPDVIAHGMLMMAYLGRLLTNWAPQEKIRSFRARFVAMTPVHAVATCKGKVIAIRDGLARIELSIHLADGTNAVMADAAVDLRGWPQARASATEVVMRRDSSAEGCPAPLLIAEQGSFAIGGTVLRHPGEYDSTRSGPEGQTLHGDHAFVTYQVPVDRRLHPLVFVHGNSQFSKTWQTTPDGREGFQTLFLRRGFATYLVDSPRRGAAGRSTRPALIEPQPEDQFWFEAFRIGKWPDYFPVPSFRATRRSSNSSFVRSPPIPGRSMFRWSPPRWGPCSTRSGRRCW